MHFGKYFFCFFFAFSAIFSQEYFAQDFYDAAQEAVQEEKWQEAIGYMEVIINRHPESMFVNEAIYFCGVCYFGLKDYSVADQYFSKYLKLKNTPKFFDQALVYKFEIAEQYRKGAWKRIFDLKKTPKLLPAKNDAIRLYDEIISTLPYHELTVKSLFGKAKTQQSLEDFQEAIDTFQQLIRRFPKSEYAVESFLEIGNTYLAQCKKKKLDPEVNSLVDLNLKKFQTAFPNEERLQEARVTALKVKEKFAGSLYQTGRFFEKRGKKDAAMIYYNRVVALYPGTHSAKQCEKRLDKLSG